MTIDNTLADWSESAITEKAKELYEQYKFWYRQKEHEFRTTHPQGDMDPSEYERLVQKHLVGIMYDPNTTETKPATLPTINYEKGE